MDLLTFSKDWLGGTFGSDGAHFRRRCSNLPCTTQDPPLADLIALIAKLRQAGTVSIALTGGEPMLRADLPEIIAACAPDISTTLFTTSLGKVYQVDLPTIMEHARQYFSKPSCRCLALDINQSCGPAVIRPLHHEQARSILNHCKDNGLPKLMLWLNEKNTQGKSALR